MYNQLTCGQNLNILHTKATAWARPSQGQALVDGFGLACVLRKPKPPQAKPKPQLWGQARPEQHYKDASGQAKAAASRPSQAGTALGGNTTWVIMQPTPLSRSWSGHDVRNRVVHSSCFEADFDLILTWFQFWFHSSVFKSVRNQLSDFIVWFRSATLVSSASLWTLNSRTLDMMCDGVLAASFTVKWPMINPQTWNFTRPSL